LKEEEEEDYIRFEHFVNFQKYPNIASVKKLLFISLSLRCEGILWLFESMGIDGEEM
jgi:hypothetical protein